jgi:hypothetical protein
VEILKLLDLSSLIMVSKSTGDLKSLATIAYQSNFRSLIRVLVPHHHHTFIDLMDTTGSIISGSTALHFWLNDGDWNPSDVDIYTPKGRATAIAYFLIAHAGYGQDFVYCPYPTKLGFS